LGGYDDTEADDDDDDDDADDDDDDDDAVMSFLFYLTYGTFNKLHNISSIYRRSVALLRLPKHQ
jgi:hypothetical protein